MSKVDQLPCGKDDIVVEKASVLIRGPANWLDLYSDINPSIYVEILNGDWCKLKAPGAEVKAVNSHMLLCDYLQQGTNRHGHDGLLEWLLFSLEYLLICSEDGQLCLVPKVFVFPVGSPLMWRVFIPQVSVIFLLF